MEENLNPNAEVQHEAPQTEQVTPNPPSPIPIPMQHPNYQPPQPQTLPPQHQQPNPQPRPYSNTNGYGTTGFILGVIGCVLFWIPFVRFFLGTFGLLFSCIGFSRIKTGRRTIPLIGIILSSIVLLIVITIWVGFGYTPSDLFSDGFLDFLDFLHKKHPHPTM